MSNHSPSNLNFLPTLKWNFSGKTISASRHVLLSSNTYFTKIFMKGLVISIVAFSLILPGIATKLCIKLNILASSLFYFVQFATHHFINSLVQSDKFFKIRQICNIKKDIGDFWRLFWWILKKLSYCLGEFRKWFVKNCTKNKLVASRWLS